MISAVYVNTNLIAHDWHALAHFYEHIFGCVPVPPERHLSDRWLEELAGVPGAQIQGIHLRLPGHGPKGPTLEIFQYTPEREKTQAEANRPGFAHIAFSVENVQEALDAVTDAGGRPLGKLIQADIPGAGHLTAVYALDPEGNMIELQRWSSAGLNG